MALAAHLPLVSVPFCTLSFPFRLHSTLSFLFLTLAVDGCCFRLAWCRQLITPPKSLFTTRKRSRLLVQTVRPIQDERGFIDTSAWEAQNGKKGSQGRETRLRAREKHEEEVGRRTTKMGAYCRTFFGSSGTTRKSTWR